MASLVSIILVISSKYNGLITIPLFAFISTRFSCFNCRIASLTGVLDIDNLLAKYCSEYISPIFNSPLIIACLRYSYTCAFNEVRCIFGIFSSPINHLVCSILLIFLFVK